MIPGMIACPMTDEKFRNHMKNKFIPWGAALCAMGKDFAVFTFTFAYTVVEVSKNLEQYASYYGYKFEVKDKKLVVINNPQI